MSGAPINTGSPALDRIVERLGTTADPKRRYEYVLWLAKKLQPFPEELRTDEKGEGLREPGVRGG